MNTVRKLAAGLLCGFGVVIATPASAQHHRGGGPRVTFGFHFGAPVGWYYAPAPYYYYPPPYYYPSRVVVVPAEPTVYVERESAPPAQPQVQTPANYWYYCSASRAYYPYVRECPGGWEPVPPRPAQ